MTDIDRYFRNADIGSRHGFSGQMGTNTGQNIYLISIFHYWTDVARKFNLVQTILHGGEG